MTDFRALCAELITALHDAADDVEGWGNYASDYFQVKHDLTGNIAKIHAQADRARAALAEQPVSKPYTLELTTDGELATLRELALKELDAWSEERNGPGESIICDGLAVRLIRDALAAEPVPPADGEVGELADTRYEFSVLDADCVEQAGGSAPSLTQALDEGRHYLASYAQDGLHTLELRRVEVLSTDHFPGATKMVEPADGEVADGPAVPEGREPASVAEDPSDEELLDLMPETMRDEFSYAAKVCSDATGGQIKPGIFRVCLNRTALEFARAVLARWGRQPSSDAPAPCPPGG